MSDTEFDIIRRYFMRQQPNRKDVITGIGDDAALLQVPAGMELVVSMDTLVDAVHFLRGTTAAAIGHKALAVNLSDLAAMGAEPAWVTLSLTLPEADANWLADFSQAFFKLADCFGVQLVGDQRQALGSASFQRDLTPDSHWTLRVDLPDPRSTPNFFLVKALR